MEFPDASTLRAALDPDAVEWPRFVRVRDEPPAPTVDDPAGEARAAVAALPLDRVPAGGRVAVGLGSRGIHDVVPVARAVVDELADRGFEPVVVPAMGSHGGATAAGQRRTLAELGLTEEALSCPVDARMDTRVVATTPAGMDVHVAVAALAADGVVVVNRVKAHTNFRGRVESGLCKMLAVGLGKRAGANSFHDRALVDGYVPTIEAAVDAVREAAPVLGGVAVVENALDRTALVEGVPVDDLPEREVALLARADELTPTLPHPEVDVLVVDRVGKDVSGAGMDTNTIGRYEVLNAEEPPEPDVKRIVVRGLTEATHGNAQGIGLADLTTRAVSEAIDFDQMYTNALTSGSLSKARLPVVLPDDAFALAAALSTIGPYDPGRVRVVWIRDTNHLTEYRVSEGLVEDLPASASVGERLDLSFVDGEPRFEPVDEGDESG